MVGCGLTGISSNLIIRLGKRKRMLGIGGLLLIVGGIMLVWWNNKEGRKQGLIISLILYIIGLKIWLEVISKGMYKEEILGVGYGVDGMSVYLVLLTVILIPLCILSVWDHEEVGRYVGIMLIVEGIVLGVFTVENVLWFYVYFESVLIPMYVMVGRYGSRERKVRAGYYLFIYTLLGSVFMMIGMIIMYLEIGSLDYENIRIIGLGEEIERIVWLLFFMGFLVKIPMVPAHIWLAEAHVEAPTEGSVILAGVLLKLGTYGFLRYSVELMGMSSVYYLPLINVLGGIGMIYTALTCLRQTDVKRIIAYGSVGHMSMTILGLVSLREEGIEGGVLQMVSHGIVSGGLFVCIGMIYNRVKTRNILYMSGLAEMMPILGIIMLGLVLGNMGFPGTSSFIGEFLLLDSIYSTNKYIGVLTGIGMILTGGYSLYMYNRVMFGNINRSVLVGKRIITDITIREISILIPIVVIMLGIGLYPKIIIETMTW